MACNQSISGRAEIVSLALLESVGWGHPINVLQGRGAKATKHFDAALARAWKEQSGKCVGIFACDSMASN